MRIIFHIPLKLNPKLHSASQIRPQMMVKGFIDAGYDVDIVEGSAKERKNAIKRIKKNIKNGIKYEFMYSESSTMPTLLTERNHFPSHPFLDFSFFRFCKKNGIKIGLFYRDIYWCFPEYVTSWKTKFALLFYNYDLKKYNELIDILFLPSKEMLRYLPAKYNFSIYELPSGAEIKLSEAEDKEDYIELFYVGGIGHHYDLTMLFQAVNVCPNIHLTVCCRQEDWETIREDYEHLMSNNISVIHKSGKELDTYYRKADICVLFVRPTVYWDFAMPYKLFEFIGRGKPVLASTPTKTAQFVEDNKCGITIPYDINILIETLKALDKSVIKEMTDRVISFAPCQSWEARAKEVAKILAN